MVLGSFSGGDVPSYQVVGGALVCLLITPLIFAFASLWAVLGLCASGVIMFLLALNFRSKRTRVAARKLFLYTLLFLPVCLGLLIIGWKV